MVSTITPIAALKSLILREPLKAYEDTDVVEP